MKKALYPRPKEYTSYDGILNLPEIPVLLFHKDSEGELFKIVSAFKKELSDRAGIDCYPVPDYSGKLTVSIEFLPDESLEGECYEIEITDEKITLSYGTPVAAFRGKETLLQLFEINGLSQPTGKYLDWPDLRRRGFMLDISRAKVPTLEKLFHLVDVMAALKMNELQLYLETYVYEYQEYPQHAHIAEALTPFEILQLTNYAKERYVDLVPNQNSFGHLRNWLRLDEFKELRSYDGENCASLNPLDPRSLDFVEGLYSSLLPAFDSEYLNIGCDEVWDLDKGKTKEKAEQVGELGVYLDFLELICKKAEEHGKRPQFWGDVLLNETEDTSVIERVSKNMIPLIWNYNGKDDAFDRHGKVMSTLGYDFYICPGTSSWIAMFPDLNNSCLNVLNGAEAAVEYGAMGMLMTEWGDFGHIQCDFAMELGLIYSGALSWSLEGSRDFELACNYADSFLYKCEEGSVSDIIRAGSDLYDENYFWMFERKFTDNNAPKKSGTFNYDHYMKVKNGMQDMAEKAKALKMTAADSELLRTELIASAKLYSLMTDYMLFRLEYEEKGKIDDFDTRLAAFLAEYASVKTDFKRCWNARNKEYDNEHMFRQIEGGFDDMIATVKNEN